MNRIAFGLFLFFVVSVLSCGDDEPMIKETPSFDRSTLLAQWADNIIIPSFENYQTKVTQLKAAKDAFITNATENTLDDLRSDWLAAYLAWQDVSIFDIGMAEEIGLRNATNIFPTNVDLINSNIQSQNYNLTLPSNLVAQGYPALDYLLYGKAESKSEIVTALSDASASEYLSDLVNRLSDRTNSVVSDWKGTYRDDFVGNDGSSATASTDKMVNDFLFYYEKFLRAGKIGIPAGVFSGSTISSSVEAPFSGQYSKMLFLRGMDAVERFFYGRSFNGNAEGVGLDDYIAHVAEQNGTINITSSVQGYWTSAITNANGLLDNFKEQVESDNSKMLQTYDELQKAVPLLKVDILQALNIQVDFVDADGD